MVARLEELKEEKAMLEAALINQQIRELKTKKIMAIGIAIFLVSMVVNLVI